MENFKLNDRVLVFGKNTKGKIAFIGETHFADGQMFGVILDEPKGKYSGTIDNVCYFECQMNHGTFVRACQLEKDCGSTLEDWNRPAYPNYLKASSSKHEIKTQGSLKKTEEGNKSKLKTSDSVDLENSRNKQVKKEENNIPSIPNGLEESGLKQEYETQGKTSKMGNSRKANSKTSDSVNHILRNKKMQKENFKQVIQNNLGKGSSKSGLKEHISKTENSKTKMKSSAATVDILDNMHLLKEECNKPKLTKYLTKSRSTHVFTAEKEISKPINSKRNVNPIHLAKSQDEVFKKGSEKLTKSKSTHGLSSKVEALKSEKSKRKLDLPNLEKTETSRSNLIQTEIFQKGDTIINSLSFGTHEERYTDEELISNELSTTKQRISDQENRMISLRSYLRMLTTYFKWNEECEKSPETGDAQIKSFLNLLINNIMKKIQDVVSQKPGDKTFDAFEENSSVLTEENNLLLLRITLLEKRNEVLTESLMGVRDIFERAWNRSRSNRCKRTETCNGKDHDKDKKCKQEESFTDIIEQETRLFVKSNPTQKTNPSSSKILEKLKGPERIKQYLESLLDNKGFYNQEDTNYQDKDGSYILELDDTRGQQFMYCSPEPKISLDSQEPKKRGSGLTVRSTLASETKPNAIFQDQKKFPFEMNPNDPTKELKDLISELSLNATRIKKSPTNCSRVNSSKKLLKNSTKKSNTEENISSM
ncbi:hypothetical protein JTE90_004567 [Oedothorax gibbosus]|uniref:CAP-Gly domain-containing protein n=1 Tax=Oedothorax gibbosus TaxID=931172 RepID=A0AAV6UIZ3_9ARAC|nr:hypothetical protein JTE90_004567 [Oedothorax gibbosus]